jgi:hypothetical protein
MELGHQVVLADWAVKPEDVLILKRSQELGVLLEQMVPREGMARQEEVAQLQLTPNNWPLSVSLRKTECMCKWRFTCDIHMHSLGA